MKIRSNAVKSPAFTLEENSLCIRGDEAERKQITATINTWYQKRHRTALLNLELAKLKLQQGSSFSYVHKPLSILLRELVQSFHRDASAKFTSDGLSIKMSAGSDGNAESVQQQIEQSSRSIATLDTLKSALELTGGAIRSENKGASFAQWLRFHGLKVPTSAEDMEKLLTFLQWELRSSDRIESYWEYIDGHAGKSVVLSASQCQDIRALTEKFSPGGKSLLSVLYENVNPVMHDAVDWENADNVIRDIVHHSFSYDFAKKYIDSLGWWGARGGERYQVEDCAHILYTAILLQLDPLIGSDRRRNVIAGYDLYSPAVAADKPLNTIRQGFEEHLVSNKRVSRKLAPLASHMLLASAAPGFLISGVPAWLIAGSIGWVTFTQAVNLIEEDTKGASRFVHYDDVMLFADMGSISSAVEQLQSILAIDVIVDWALINEVITRERFTASPAEAAQTALNAYQTHVETMVAGAKAFSTPVPRRKNLALAALEKAIPGGDFFEEPLLRPGPYSSMRVSMVDLHIEGELTSGQWDWNKSPHVLSHYPQLSGLARNQTVFEQEVGKYHSKIHAAMASNIKLALSGMPRRDREIFQNNKITFLTVRAPVAEWVYPTDTNYNLVGTANKGPKKIEVRAKKDQARGRFGVIMVASYEGNKILCYELFSLLGECRRNDRLGELVKNTGKLDMPAWIDFKGSPGDPSFPLPPTSDVPTDFESYLQGTRPQPNVSSNMVIENLGTLPAPASTVVEKQSIYQFFMNAHIENIAQFVVKHRPVGSVSDFIQAFTVLTDKERIANKTDEVVTYIIDLVVPFKKCIEDLSSGERNKVVEGVYGCTMDAVGIFFTVLGAPAKLLSIAARTASLTSKLGSAVKYGLQLTISTFNPIDGLPTLGFNASKVLLKNGIELSTAGVKLLDTASSQLHRLTGRRQSVDFLKTASLPQVGQGKWRPRGSTATVLNACALSRNNQWYAINSRGNPWGKQLEGFEFQHVISLPSVRPESYTRYIVQQSLPVARAKIDTAIRVLELPPLNFKTDLAIGLFLGSTPGGRDKLSNLLKTIRLNIYDTSISNFFLDIAKVDDQIIEFSQTQYSEWKAAGLHERKNIQYFTVGHQNLNDRFNAAGFNYGEIADDLLHEMFRAESGKLDLVSAKAALLNNKPALNVTPLLNLVAGRLPKSDGTGGNHAPADAWLNADSLAVLIALLNLIGSGADAPAEAFATLDAAVKNNAGRAINSDVLVSLNSYRPRPEQ